MGLWVHSNYLYNCSVLSKYYLTRLLKLFQNHEKIPFILTLTDYICPFWPWKTLTKRNPNQNQIAPILQCFVFHEPWWFVPSAPVCFWQYDSAILYFQSLAPLCSSSSTCTIPSARIASSLIYTQEIDRKLLAGRQGVEE